MEVSFEIAKRLGHEVAFLLAFFNEAKKVAKGAMRYSLRRLEKDSGLSIYVLIRTLQVLETEGLIHIKRLTKKSRMIIELPN